MLRNFGKIGVHLSGLMVVFLHRLTIMRSISIFVERIYMDRSTDFVNSAEVSRKV